MVTIANLKALHILILIVSDHIYILELVLLAIPAFTLFEYLLSSIQFNIL
jgi:hypothetical protein